MHSNKYTIIYAVVLTVIIAVVLSLLAVGLREKQDTNVRLDKKASILNSVTTATMENADRLYEERIEEIVVDVNGNVVEGVKAFNIDLKKENRKEPEDMLLPLYVYKSESGNNVYIMPLEGLGLWGPLHGFIALDHDFNTITGAVFTHDKETPGLGAEVTTEWFQEQFIGKQLVKAGEYQFTVLKGRVHELNEYEVDGISGATITSKGVGQMIERQYNLYSAYFDKLKGQQS